MLRSGIGLVVIWIGAFVALAGPVAAEPLAHAPNASPANLSCTTSKFVKPRPAPDYTPEYGWLEMYHFEDPRPSPWSVALDKDCNVYVADHRHPEVVRLDPTGKKIGPSYRLPKFPGESGEGTAESVAVDLEGNVYVTDSQRNLVFKFKSNGEMHPDSPNGWETCTTNPPPNVKCYPRRMSPVFSVPTAIAVDGPGTIVYVATAHRIEKVDAHTGRELGVVDVLQKTNRPQTTLVSLYGMALDGKGNLYVADNSNREVLKISPDGAVERKAIEKAPGSFWHGVVGVAVDADGNNLYVADGLWKVLRLDAQGKFQQQWTNCLSADCTNTDGGSQPGQFGEDRALVVDGEGVLYVADYGNNRIQRRSIVNWNPPPPPDLSAPAPALVCPPVCDRVAPLVPPADVLPPQIVVDDGVPPGIVVDLDNLSPPDDPLQPADPED